MELYILKGTLDQTSLEQVFSALFLLMARLDTFVLGAFCVLWGIWQHLTR